AFSYIVKIGLEYNCVYTSKVSIFLRIFKDPKIVYYFLLVPKGNVRESIG
ncbi:hypothetical protein CC78DRAFT_477030, partial [Lojkania enalia]